MPEYSISEGKRMAERNPYDFTAIQCQNEHTGWGHGGYTCTLPVGHDGEHMAHNVKGEVAASWGT